MPFLPVSPQLFRGSQPTREDLLSLREQGLRCVFNLRQESHASRELCRELGLVYHQLPVQEWAAPDPGQVKEFLDLLQVLQPALIHCAGGVGRTSLFVSCYLVAGGMDVELALSQADLGMGQSQREWVRAWRATPAL
jgi:protein tyrosine phosphatase (PTP) superfamily phosphohydrolase (DUF442 family)